MDTYTVTLETTGREIQLADLSLLAQIELERLDDDYERLGYALHRVILVDGRRYDTAEAALDSVTQAEAYEIMGHVHDRGSDAMDRLTPFLKSRSLLPSGEGSP